MALSHVGVQESPWDSNTDGGGFIDQIEKWWGLHAEPWCAMYVSDCYREAGVDDAGVINPGTSTMCARADQKGLWLKGTSVPPGAILILCGIHTEIAVHQRSDGLIDAVGGNVNQGVRATVRQLGNGWRCIVPPAILLGQSEPVRVYGFDDPAHMPRRYGPWHDRASREATIAKLQQAEQRWVRRIRIPGQNQYAFEVLDPQQWRYGPWQDRATRDREMAAMQQKVARSMRPWSQAMSPQDGTGGVTTGETTT